MLSGVCKGLALAAAAWLVVADAPSLEASGYRRFFGSGAGAIPDPTTGTCGTTSAAPLNITFNVSGLTGTVRSVRVVINATHTYVGDLDVRLTSPNLVSQTVFSRTGAISAPATGEDANLNGTYEFIDSIQNPASGGWWQAAVAVGPGIIPPGAYRSTAPGGAGATNPSPATSLTAPFAGSNPNGVWTLRTQDVCVGDDGSINSAQLYVATTTTGGQRFFDNDGNGVSDFTIARPDTGALVWYTLNSLGLTTTVWGAQGDTLVSGDYDGDGKSDVAVWRPAAPSTFWVLRSSDGGLLSKQWGLSTDDAEVSGDYDGDGKTDFAVFRCPASPGQCYFYVNRSSDGGLTVQPWGLGVQSDYKTAPGDYNGDGRADFAVFALKPGSATLGQFYIQYTSGGTFTFAWGNFGDVVVPGDYDGDGTTDLAIRRLVSGSYQWWIRGSSVGLILTNWGSAGDMSASGDYDGDGRTDIAIWRASATPGQTAFWVRPSTTLGIMVQQWGHLGDIPVAAFVSH